MLIHSKVPFLLPVPLIAFREFHKNRGLFGVDSGCGSLYDKFY